ncbi:MAG: decarboxylating NADP(+)-dependent phosphogluconate dehydrogenase [Bacteroidales bacterium]|nr:decarboxylating NADP(+)-dependent phosphogluconate dehydrogenase [Bacteroidales bacterium]
MEKTDIGLIGLAVMGENLVLNMENKGYRVSVYNRTAEVTKKFSSGKAKGKNIIPFYNLEEFVESLASPRRVMLMVKAGEAVDMIIDSLLPLLSSGDIIIDGGNSFYKDTDRRVKYVESKGLYYIGTGISGGEEGALKGPSIMPGGSVKAWPHVKPLFMDISAKAEDGTACCEWTGPGGAGHFVKMVHNGIEYADMQLISEVYFLLKRLYKKNNDEIGDYFRLYNEGKLKSYLMEITADILKHKDKSGDYVLDTILDSAGQKGTGRWTVNSAMELGVPLNIIATAVFERYLSSLTELRDNGEYIYQRKLHAGYLEEPDEVFNAMYCSKVASYSQGFDLMEKASKEYGWNLDLAAVARIWRNGCIIRSVFLDDIAKTFDGKKSDNTLLLSPLFVEEIDKHSDIWKEVVSDALSAGLSVPVMSASLNYFFSLTTKRSPANLLQAQRDYFGAHTFEKVDKPRGEFYHEEWIIQE